MRRRIKDNKLVVKSQEVQDRDAKIKAMLANIPCMSKETLTENRKKIEAHHTPVKIDPKQSAMIRIEQSHSKLL